MSKTATLIPLSQILTKSNNWIDIKPTERYKQVTVKIWGKGVVERNEITGAEIFSNTRLKVNTGQFILSRIDARHGAFGLIPESLSGAVVTNDFPVFSLNQNLIVPQFLNWISKTESFIELCKSASEGTTNRVRLKESKFLSMEIPLPPLEEQRRIVGRIEELAGKIAEARGLKDRSIQECDDLSRSILFHCKSQSKITQMSDLVYLRKPDVSVSPEQTYHFAGVYSFGRGLFRQVSQTGMNFSYQKLTRIKTGNFIYPKLMAWEGALGIVPSELDECVVSPEFPVFEVNEDKILPEVLDTYFRTPSVWDVLAQASTGTNARRRRLHPSNFLRLEIPVPPMEVQLQLRTLKQKVQAGNKIRYESLKELDALLPAIWDKAFKGEL